jgi:hypothetical protein
MHPTVGGEARSKHLVRTKAQTWKHLASVWGVLVSSVNKVALSINKRGGKLAVILSLKRLASPLNRLAIRFKSEQRAL